MLLLTMLFLMFLGILRLVLRSLRLSVLCYFDFLLGSNGRLFW